MTFRHLLPFVAAVALLPGQALGQFISAPERSTFDTDTKSKVLTGIEEILLRRAFVPNLDFSLWKSMVSKHQTSFDDAESPQSFTGRVNQALREFGISHVGLRAPSRQPTTRDDNDSDGGSRSEIWADWTAEVEALQSRSQSQTSIKWLDDKTVLFRLSSFSSGYSRDGIEELFKEASTSERMVIDLRNNGGGAVSNLSHFLGTVLPEQTVVGTFISRRTVSQYTEENGEAKQLELVKIADWSKNKFRASRLTSIEPYKGKIAVLINGASASASEIFASALQETDRAVVVGSKSRGAVLASTYGTLHGGFRLQYPVSDYVTLKGVRLEGTPVTPDIEVNSRSRSTDADDPVVAAALKAIDQN